MITIENSTPKKNHDDKNLMKTFCRFDEIKRKGKLICQKLGAHLPLKYKRFKKKPGFNPITISFSKNPNYWQESLFRGSKAKHYWVMSTNLLFPKVC